VVLFGIGYLPLSPAQTNVSTRDLMARTGHNDMRVELI
jgi:hypothetical protein